MGGWAEGCLSVLGRPKRQIPDMIFEFVWAFIIVCRDKLGLSCFGIENLFKLIK